MFGKGSVEEKSRGSTQTTLYRFIFCSYIAKFSAFSLLAFLLLQPCAQAYAAIGDATSTDTQPAEQIEIPAVQIPVVDASQPVDASINAPTVATTTKQSISQNATLPQQSSVSTNASSTESASSSVPTQGIQTQFASSTSVTGSTTVPDTSTTTSEVTATQSTATSTLATQTQSTSVASSSAANNLNANALATKTPALPVPVVHATTTPEITKPAADFHNASEFQFNTSQCAVVGNGAYYCNDKKATSSLLSDGVFSAPDSDGDLEIFIRVGGKETQITHNTYDDTSPHYDARSNRIVWQSYINDRYQIISYDLKTQKMVRLTDAPYNNMEPVAYGTTTVWQAWINNNWEIMLYDGVTLKQLTKNTVEDVAPHVRDGYVVWQTQFADGWQVAVYNIETKRIEYIPSEGGQKVENPRFVLVYDSTDKNGDIQTKGYDFDSKTSFDLGRLPQEVPDKLPNPDQTGETRALIQNKQSSRESELEQAITAVNGTSTVATGTTTPNTLDLSVSSGTTTAIVSTSTPVAVVDVVVPVYVATSSVAQLSTTPVIPDLVIPPVSSTSTLEVR